MGLTSSLSLVYGSALLPVYFLVGPIVILQGIYAKYFGLDLTVIAMVLLLSRVFDAVTDPLIGYVADRYYARRRSYKPFIISGGLLFIIASWFLYVPFDVMTLQPKTHVGGGYFLGWFLVFYLAYTLFEIPHLAWGSALAADCQEKNKVYGLRSFCIFLGMLLFFAVPLLPWFETNEFTPHTLKVSVLASGLLMLPMLYFCIKTVPDTTKLSAQLHRNNNHQSPKESLGQVLRAIFANKPLRVLTAAQLCAGFGSGMWFSLVFLFVDTYLEFGKQFAWMYVISFSLSIVSLRLWYQLAGRWGKQVSLGIGMLLVAIGSLGTGLLAPASSGWLSLLCCMTLIYSGYAAFNILLPSMLSDIVDYGTWKFGIDRAATYFSLYTLLNKMAAALGGALGLAIAAWYGFDPTATSHSETAIAGLRLGVAWIPALITLLSIVLIVQIPITARHHAIIRRRLDTRLIHAASLVETIVNNPKQMSTKSRITT